MVGLDEITNNVEKNELVMLYSDNPLCNIPNKDTRILGIKE